MRNLFPSNVFFIFNVSVFLAGAFLYGIKSTQWNLVKTEVNIDFVDFTIHLTFKVKLWIPGYEFEDQDLYQNLPVPIQERLEANHPPYINNNSVADPDPTFPFDASRNDGDQCGSGSATLTNKLNLDMPA